MRVKHNFKTWLCPVMKSRFVPDWLRFSIVATILMDNKHCVKYSVSVCESEVELFPLTLIFEIFKVCKRNIQFLALNTILGVYNQHLILNSELWTFIAGNCSHLALVYIINSTQPLLSKLENNVKMTSKRRFYRSFSSWNVFSARHIYFLCIFLELGVS